MLRYRLPLLVLSLAAEAALYLAARAYFRAIAGRWLADEIYYSKYSSEHGWDIQLVLVTLAVMLLTVLAWMWLELRGPRD